MIGNLIGGFITILVGVNLMPTVANAVAGSRYHNSTLRTNLTGAGFTIIGLVPLFYALGIMCAGVALTATGLRAAGMLGV